MIEGRKEVLDKEGFSNVFKAIDTIEQKIQAMPKQGLDPDTIYLKDKLIGILEGLSVLKVMLHDYQVVLDHHGYPIDDWPGQIRDFDSAEPVRTKALEALGKIKQSQKDGGIIPPEKAGGVDFRALPSTVTPMVGPAAGMSGLNLISLQDLDKKWSEIKETLMQGEMPYQQLKEYVSSCSGCQDADNQLKTATTYITDILKMEEERALPTAPELKEILAYLG
jgi:hypothetical protein